ncbi:unnamed protein product [Allacma fusca]|uniref:Uncharacterized protein n=1 Tax=Allacma fusca TaxID=39272 RepID=A0A8J2KZ95_9HEXA|nr:unnamed protein product [Allacma fusca]
MIDVPDYSCFQQLWEQQLATGNDDDEDAEDEQLLQKLRMRGKAGKVRVVRKRSDSTSLSEWKTDFYLLLLFALGI